MVPTKAATIIFPPSTSGITGIRPLATSTGSGCTTYQKRTERVGTQVGYNDGVSDPTAGNSYRDELSQLDFSANWDVNENIGLVFNVTNLTAEPTVNRSVTGTVWQVQENDRRFTLGLRAKL